MQGAYGIGLLTEDSEIRRLADLLLFQKLPYRGAQVLETAIANRAVTLDDKLYEKLANCWLAAGEFDKAIAPLARAAELADTGNLFVRLGEANMQLENWTAAQEALERGISKGGLADAANAQMLHGHRAVPTGRTPEARGWFQQVPPSVPHREMATRYLLLMDSPPDSALTPRGGQSQVSSRPIFYERPITSNHEVLAKSLLARTPLRPIVIDRKLWHKPIHLS